MQARSNCLLKKNKQRVLREMSVVLRRMKQRLGQPFCFVTTAHHSWHSSQKEPTQCACASFILFDELNLKEISFVVMLEQKSIYISEFFVELLK
jgi:hypothetical protein